MVEPENVPLPLKPLSQVWLLWMGLNRSQSGLIAVKLPEASGPEIPDPPTAVIPPSLKMIWNEVMGLLKALLVIRTVPLTPLFQTVRATTSTVTPLPATAVTPSSVEYSG